MMKKAIAFAMMTAMLISAAGCQNAKEEAETIESNVEEDVQAVEEDVNEAAETVEEDAKEAAESVEEGVEEAAETVEEDAKEAVKDIEVAAEDIEQEIKDKFNEEVTAIPQDVDLAKEKAMEAISTVEEKLGIEINRETTDETIDGEWDAYAVFYDAKYITLSSFGAEAVDLTVDADAKEATLVYDISDEDPVTKTGSFEISDGVAVFDGDLAGMIAYIDNSDPSTLMVISTEDDTTQMFMLTK